MLLGYGGVDMIKHWHQIARVFFVFENIFGDAVAEDEEGVGHIMVITFADMRCPSEARIWTEAFVKAVVTYRLLCKVELSDSLWS